MIKPKTPSMGTAITAVRKHDPVNLTAKARSLKNLGKPENCTDDTDARLLSMKSLNTRSASTLKPTGYQLFT